MLGLVVLVALLSNPKVLAARATLHSRQKNSPRKILEVNLGVLVGCALVTCLVCCRKKVQSHCNSDGDIYYFERFDGVTCDVSKDNTLVDLCNECFESVACVPVGFHLDLVLTAISFI